MVKDFTLVAAPTLLRAPGPEIDTVIVPVTSVPVTVTVSAAFLNTPNM